jgi:hypothetical protein
MAPSPRQGCTKLEWPTPHKVGALTSHPHKVVTPAPPPIRRNQALIPNVSNQENSGDQKRELEQGSGSKQGELKGKERNGSMAGCLRRKKIHSCVTDSSMPLSVSLSLLYLDRWLTGQMERGDRPKDYSPLAAQAH